MPLTLTQTAAPAVEAMTIAEAKTHLRVDWSDDDDYIDALITAAREACEQYLRRQFITATYVLRMDKWPVKPEVEIVVPRPPLQSVTSITYVDTAGATQTWSSLLYQADIYSQPGRIRPAYGETWPELRSDTLNAVTITYKAGYGDDATAIPERFIKGMEFLIAQWWENREAVVVGSAVNQLPVGVELLLGPFRVLDS